MISTYTSLNFDLGETNDMLREQVNQFAGAQIVPLAQATDLNNRSTNSFRVISVGTVFPNQSIPQPLRQYPRW